LTSRFALTDKFTTQGATNWIQRYSESVRDYKDETVRIRKNELTALIEEFHNQFSSQLVDETTDLKKQLARKYYLLSENQNPLFTQRTDSEKAAKVELLKKQIDRLEKQIAAVSEKYKHAVE